MVRDDGRVLSRLVRQRLLVQLDRRILRLARGLLEGFLFLEE
jgi:hypothetical protein